MAEVRLIISRIIESGPARYAVTVAGTGFSHVTEDASVVVKIRGDDKWFDDNLFNMAGDFLGGSFSASKIVYGSQLNEDWGTDEIYATVEVEGAFPHGVYKTNTVTGSY